MIITDDLGGVWRILGNLGEAGGILEKLGKSWRSWENLGEAGKISEKLGEARRVSKGGGGVNALWQSPRTLPKCVM